MARSLNKVQLIGNLTRDPELRYTPNGNAVSSFSVATNRSWTTDSGEKKEDAEYHRIIAWNKLAEICSQLLVKGSKVYVEGRLTTRSWQAQDGQQKSITEIIAEDVLVLDSKKSKEGSEHTESVAAEKVAVEAPVQKVKEEKKTEKVKDESEIAPDDIPF